MLTDEQLEDLATLHIAPQIDAGEALDLTPLLRAVAAASATLEREACAVLAERWGETHGDGETVNARNAGSKIARGIRQRSNVLLSGAVRRPLE